MTRAIAVRKCDSLDDFHACVELQREIWGESDLEIEPATLFVVAANTGGQVLGAFDGEKLVGYTLALAGVRDRTPYLHSHMTGVKDGYRDRGVGRSLKLFQRDEALSRGIRRVEWTFDPFEMRNAHFNLNRLGAVCRRYLPNLYGVTTSPLHRDIPTDRLVAEWYLDSHRVVDAIADKRQDPAPGRATIELPPELNTWKSEDPAKLAALQLTIREEFKSWFSRGYIATGVRSAGQAPAYLLRPAAETDQ
ncbi:MAG TPA: GNAT family N-acetyltransferase [Candidatus Saccharimonadales bacterium]|nr:GNAT family N-acetyltransferase [Candidatus Saccharimonadales bacterium]